MLLHPDLIFRACTGSEYCFTCLNLYCGCNYCNIQNASLNVRRWWMLWFHGLWYVFLVTNKPSHAELCLCNAPIMACITCLFVFCCRQGSRGRSTTFITPRGLTLVSQNPPPPSSISSSRFGSLAHWAQSMGPQWCTAALGLDARGPSPWWTPAWSWWGGFTKCSHC